MNINSIRNPEEKEPEIAESETVITIEKTEVDTLAIQDISGVLIHVNTSEEITKLFRSIGNLTPLQIRIIEVRYLSIIRDYENRIIYIDILYHLSRTIVSLGSVAVPAMLSIQSPTGANSIGLYWLTWTISLLVTVCHNFNSIFRFDKKFFGLHTTLERLKSEGWQYLELSGHYSGHHGQIAPTHQNQYVYFVNSIERIQLKQVEEEFNTIKEPEKQNIAQVKPVNEQAVPSPLDLTINRGKKS